MGSQIPKQFLELGGKPILQRTIERFTFAEPDIRVITVLPENHRRLWEELCIKHALNVPQIIAEGGITRFHSVQKALAFVPEGATVAIQDGVRPLVSGGLIKKMFALMAECRALIPVTPVTDSLKLLEKEEGGASGCTVQSAGSALGSPSRGGAAAANTADKAYAELLPLRSSDAPEPDRSRLFAAQTPQIFRSEDIKSAYGRLGFRLDFTDDASVAKAAGIPLSYIAGEKYNIKITTPDDLRLAELLINL